MNVVAISPHLDDAALSCGVRLLRHARRGDKVTVVTCFTEGAPHERRRHEDAAACGLLGAECRHLPFLDAPDRDPRFADIVELVFGNPGAVDVQVGTALRRQLAAVLAPLAPSVVYAPLGVGMHIDHRLTFEAVLGLGAPNVVLYEERPYCLWPGLTAARLCHLGVEPGPDATTLEEMATSVGKIGFHSAFLPAGKVREQLLPLYLASLDPRHLDSEPCVVATADTLEATPDEAETIWRVLSEYRSQIDALYPSHADFDRDNRAHARRFAEATGYVERTFRVSGRGSNGTTGWCADRAISGIRATRAAS